MEDMNDFNEEVNDAVNEQFSRATHSALDAAHVAEIDSAFEELEKLEQHATPGPWETSTSGGAIITKTVPEPDAGIQEYYGGRVILETCCEPDRQLIIALRNHAAILIRQCKNITSMTADLDGVHEALGIDYNQSAADATRAIVEEKARLLGVVGRLQKKVEKYAPGFEEERSLKDTNAFLERELNNFREREKILVEENTRLTEALATVRELRDHDATARAEAVQLAYKSGQEATMKWVGEECKRMTERLTGLKDLSER